MSCHVTHIQNVIKLNLVMKLTSSRPFFYDQKCTEMYMEILMTHNIKNYEKL